jgi:alkaline phosphatase D
MPLRTSDVNVIYRNFTVGNLINLIMLDTRVIGRDKQLEYSDYISPTTGAFNDTAFQSDWLNPSRTLLGSTQRSWLMAQVSGSSAKWQVLGQQVLMGKMFIPTELLFRLDAVVAGTPGALEEFQANISALVAIKLRYLNNDPTLTSAEIARINTVLPYNLDAWDGYPAEREMLYASFAASGKKIICLAGDTHNAWYSDLVSNGNTTIGKEFATACVTSPGLDFYLGIDATNTANFEFGMETLINDLNYLNASDRGYQTLRFTTSAVESNWNFVNTIFNETYTETTDKVATYEV